VARHRIAFTERLSARRAHVILRSLREARRCRGYNGKLEEKYGQISLHGDHDGSPSIVSPPYAT
jgi:hypothetical protein